MYMRRFGASAGRMVLAAVLVGALCLRLVFVFVFPGPITWSDACVYHRTAALLATTGEYHNILHAPGYAAFVAAFYKLFGPHQLPVQLTQVVLGTLTVFLAYCIAREILGAERRSWAIVVAALLAFDPGVASFSAWLLQTTVNMLLVALATWLLLRLLTRGHWGAAIGLGFVLGAMAYTRIEGVIFVAAGCFFGLFHARWRLRALGGGLLAAAIGMSLALPWAMHASRQYGFFGMSSGIGPNLFARNWHLSPTGDVEPEFRQHVQDVVEREGLSEISQRNWIVAMTVLNEVPEDDPQARAALHCRMEAVALENIRRHPGSFLKLLPRNFATLMGGHPFLWWPQRWMPSTREALQGGHWGVVVVKVVSYIVWPVLVLPFVAGGFFWAVIRRDLARRSLLVLGPAAACSLIAILLIGTQGEPRYRMPYDPILYTAAILGFGVLIGRIRLLSVPPTGARAIQ